MRRASSGILREYQNKLETRPQAMIFEKESGVLGYTHELSSPLNADHHSICKVKSKEDDNDKHVKDVLKLWASRLFARLHPRCSSKCLQNIFHFSSTLESMLEAKPNPGLRV